ncbi:MAG: hypothetical protein ACI8RW_001655 [Porticoccaceae bacterium]|jgi:hypothetical protein
MFLFRPTERACLIISSLVINVYVVRAIFIPIAALKSIVSRDVSGAKSGHFYWYFSEVFTPALNTVIATDNGQIMRSIKAGV